MTLASNARPDAPFDLLASKLRAPRTDHGVPRTALVDSLERARETPIVVFAAGPGYGKTTTLTQWASVADRPFAWVSLDRHDNDPVVLLTYIAAALDAIVPLDPAVFQALASPGTSIQTKLVPRLGAAFARTDHPVVLVLDDLHAVENPECIDALVALADNIGDGSQLVLSTRDDAAFPLGRWRTRGLTAEFGAEALRMSDEEAAGLLHAAEVSASGDEVAGLVQRTEGWPAGLYLAALSARASSTSPRLGSILSGNDPLVVDFLRSEVIASLAPDQLRLLMRTSLLDRLSGPLCDDVLGSTGSAEVLESLARSNRFVVALDRNRTWYRCHRLLRDLLHAELERAEPEMVPELLQRASAWCLTHAREVEGVHYAQEAGDVPAVARAVERHAQRVFQSGRVATVAQWFDWLRDHQGNDRYPAVAVIGAMFSAVNGQATDCDRWTSLAAMGRYEDPLPDGSASIESWRAMVRAIRCTKGIGAMRADATLAVGSLAPGSPWRPPSITLLGLACLLSGEPLRADDQFVDCVEESHAFAPAGSTPVVVPVALAERALVAIGRGAWDQAGALSEQAVDVAGASRNVEAALHAIAYAAAARVALHEKDERRATTWLTEAQRRLPGLTYACPVPAVQVRLEMATSYLLMADNAGARTVLDEVDVILRRVPDLGPLGEQAQSMRPLLGAPGRDVPGFSALSAAELRILPLMATHLTFPEMASRQFLSPHTVKSHAMSIYRKLDATSRSQAVERARGVGLL